MNMGSIEINFDRARIGLTTRDLSDISHIPINMPPPNMILLHLPLPDLVPLHLPPPGLVPLHLPPPILAPLT